MQEKILIAKSIKQNAGLSTNSNSKGGFPLFAETTRSELASTRWLAEQFPLIL